MVHARALVACSLLAPVYFWLATTAKGDCQDKHSNCAYWAVRRQCEVNPLYMLYTCRRSCKVCTADCVDKSTKCKDWVSSCRSYLYMVNNCKKTCGICTCCPAASTTIATTITKVTTNYSTITNSPSSETTVSTLTGQLTSIVTTSSKAFTGITKTDAIEKTDLIVTTEFPSHTSTAENITPEQRHTNKSNNSLTILAVAVAVSIALLCLITLLWFWNRKRKRSSSNQSSGNSSMTDPATHLNLGMSEHWRETIPMKDKAADGSLQRSNDDNSTCYPIYDYSVAEHIIGQLSPLRQGPAPVPPGKQHGRDGYPDVNIYEDPKDQFGLRLDMRKCPGAQEQNEEESTNPLEVRPIYWVLEGPDSSPGYVPTVASTSNYQCLKKQSSSQYQTLRKS